MKGKLTKEKFENILPGLPFNIQEYIVGFALGESSYKDILSYLRSIEISQIRSNSNTLYQVKLVSKCISSISIGDNLAISIEGFPNFTEYVPNDSIYKLIMELISTNTVYFRHLQLEVSSDKLLPSVVKFSNSFKEISIDDFSGHSLIESYKDIKLINELVMYKVKTIKTTFINFLQLSNAYMSGRLPVLKRIIFYINDFHDLKTFYNNKTLLQSLKESFSTPNSPTIELSYPNLCNQYNELGMVSLISKIHQILPNIDITSCASVNIPSDSKEDYWSNIENIDPKFLVLGGGILNSYEEDYYVERVKSFKNITLYGTEAHNISFVKKILRVQPSYFSKLKSLCMILEECSTSDLNNWIPKSMDTLTLDIKNFKVEGKWAPPQCLSDLKIGVHDLKNVRLLQSCNWIGCKLGLLQMYLKKDNHTNNTNREFDIGSIPSAINCISILGDCGPNTTWILKVRNLPETWPNSKTIRYLPKRALEKVAVVSDSGDSLTTIDDN